MKTKKRKLQKRSFEISSGSEKKDLDSEKIAPILPMETEEDEDDEYDLQKELEAKFDELFGPIDDDD